MIKTMFALALLLSIASAATNVSSCQNLSSANTQYTLNASLTATGISCLNITASNVSLDCLGYTVSGNNATATNGVMTTNTLSTVTNCNIRGFWYGIFSNGGTNATFTNNNITWFIAANAIGIALSNSHNFTVTNNIVTHSSANAGVRDINISSTTNGTMSRNILNASVSAASDLVRLKPTVQFITISNNTISKLAGGGAALSFETNVNNNIIANNTITNHGGTGILFTASGTSNNNVFYNNTWNGSTTVSWENNLGGTNNTFYWNNFTATSGAYISDLNGSNFYNSTKPGQNEGNFYANMNSSNLTGTAQSTGFPDYKVASGGGSYPYNNSTSGGKFVCSFAGCGDYAPLFYSPPTQVPSFTSTSENGGIVNWITPQNASANDSNFTTATFPANAYANATYLNGTNWNFSIAAGNTINGITVTVCKNASANSTMSDTEVKLIKNGTIQSTNRASGTTWTDALTCYNYGNSTDLWGTTWTPADWNNNSSGVVIAVTNRNTTNESFTQNASVLYSGFNSAVTENFTTTGDVWTWSSTAGGSALQTGTAAGWLVSNAIDTSTCTQVSVVFQSNDDDMDAAADGMYYWKNSSGSWNLIADVGRGWGADSTANEDIWLTYNNSSIAAEYRYNGFQINYSTAGLASTENWWVDNVTIYCNGTAWRINASTASIDFVNISVNSSAAAAAGITITSIAVQPSSPNVLNNLTCNITVQGNYSSYNATFEWYKNGTNQTALAGNFTPVLNNTATVIATLTSGNLSAGQNWSCNARAFNATTTSTWAMSANVTISAEGGGNSCSCPASGNWVLNMADNCNITTSCTLSAGSTFTFNGTSTSPTQFGNTTSNITITATNFLFTNFNAIIRNIVGSRITIFKWA